MPVYECCGCPQAPCMLFILDPDCAEPTHCPWMANGNVPVWREMKVVD